MEEERALLTRLAECFSLEDPGVCFSGTEQYAHSHGSISSFD